MDEESHSELEEKIDSEVVEAYKEAVKFGDLANGPYPQQILSSLKFTKKFHGIYKNNMMR